MHSVDNLLAANASSTAFLAVGYCDIVISNLTSGSVKLQYKLPPTAVLTAPAWTDFPDGSFTENVYRTIFFSEHGVQI